LEVTKIFRNRRCQRRLTVVNVTNRADVTMRLTAIKLFLCHGYVRLVVWGSIRPG
jgi:hypothetical protein